METIRRGLGSLGSWVLESSGCRRHHCRSQTEGWDLACVLRVAGNTCFLPACSQVFVLRFTTTMNEISHHSRMSSPSSVSRSSQQILPHSSLHRSRDFSLDPPPSHTGYLNVANLPTRSILSSSAWLLLLGLLGCRVGDRCSS